MGLPGSESRLNPRLRLHDVGGENEPAWLFGPLLWGARAGEGAVGVQRLDVSRPRRGYTRIGMSEVLAGSWGVFASLCSRVRSQHFRFRVNTISEDMSQE